MKKVKTQGNGNATIFKGIAQGALKFAVMPLTSGSRMTYDICTGTKQHLKGVHNNGQRYRYPRYFDQSGYMPEYDHLWAHGYNALMRIEKGKFKNEVLENVFEVSRYSKDTQASLKVNSENKFEGYFEDRVIIMTNLHILFIKDTEKLIQKVAMKDVKGIMMYYQNHQTIHVDVGKQHTKKLRT